MESARAPLATGTASSTCWCAQREPVAGAGRPARLLHEVLTRGADQLEHLARPGHQRGGAGADQLVHALRRRAGDRPGHAQQRPVQPRGPVGGVERPAAHAPPPPPRCRGRAPAMSRLRARKRSRVGAQPGASSETTAPSRGEVVEQRLGAPPGRRGPRRRPAPPRSRRRRPAPRGGPPGRSRTPLPDTTASPARATTAATSAGHVRAVGRGGARARPRRPSGELVEAQRPAHPEPERRTAALAAPARPTARSSSWCGHSSSPGITKRMPSRSARSRSRSGSSAASRAATSVRRPSRSRSRGQGRRSTATAPSSATSPASRGSPGSASRPSATRASRSSAVALIRPLLSSVGQQQRLAGAQPQRDVRPRPTPGRSTSAQVGHRPGQPVHPGRRRAGSAGRRTARRRRSRCGLRRPAATARAAPGRAPGR